MEKRPRQRKVGANAKHLEPPAERRSGYPPPQAVCDYASRIVIFSPMAASRLFGEAQNVTMTFRAENQARTGGEILLEYYEKRENRECLRTP